MVKLGGIVESGVFYTLGNVIPDTTLSEHTKTSQEDMYKVSDSCVIVYKQSVPGFCWEINALKVHCHLKTLGWAIKLPTKRLVVNVLSRWEVITYEYTVVLLVFYSTFTVIVYLKVN
jgi:hypothetical protein